MLIYNMWGNLNLGENSYMYNSGRITDTYSSGNDAQYFKNYGFPDERFPWGGMNYIGEMKHLSVDDGIILSYVKKSSRLSHLNTGDSHLPDELINKVNEIKYI